MLSAAVDDCAAIVGAEVRTLLGQADREEIAFHQLADWCDYALIIAPEFDRILETRCRWAIECGATLLGPSPDVVALCADKLALAEVWERVGVSTPPTKLFDSQAFPPPVVVKPRDGAGAIDTKLIAEQDQLLSYTPARSAVIQPYFQGTHTSVSFLIGPAQSIALRPCAQDIRILHGKFEYHGGMTVAHSNISDRSLRIAQMAAAALPELRGFVGVDVIVGQVDVAVEINPRLTTSYVGLRQIAQCNLMEKLVRVVKGESCELPSWRGDDVRFSCDGQV
jgi:tyramine---L-glutamate ligase